MSTIVDSIKPRRSLKRSQQQALFDAADQWRVRADLETFFGPNADRYLEVYEKMRMEKNFQRASVKTWSWPVFLGGFTWFFYRKMYIYGGMAIFTPIIMDYLLGSAGIGVMYLVFTMQANALYVDHALGRIAKADELDLTGLERTNYLQRAGGVSLPAGIFAGLIYSFAVAVAILGAIARYKTGHS
jgi:hypothetical protein